MTVPAGIALVRIDNRLVHGQVLEAWVPALSAQGILVADDEVAANPLARAAMGGEAMALLKQIHFVKFNETVELHMRLGVDPKHADQMVRGTVVLPHGTGKKVRVAVFAQGEKAQEALRAGADEVGADDLVKKIESGWLEFDVALALIDSRLRSER